MEMNSTIGGKEHHDTFVIVEEVQNNLFQARLEGESEDYMIRKGNGCGWTNRCIMNRVGNPSEMFYEVCRVWKISVFNDFGDFEGVAYGILEKEFIDKLC